MAKKHKASEEQTVAIVYGIDPRVKKVRTVWVQRNGVLSGSRLDGSMFSHRPHPNSNPESEARLVFSLTDVFSVPIGMLDSASTAQKIAELEEKAANLRSEEAKDRDSED